MDAADADASNGVAGVEDAVAVAVGNAGDGDTAGCGGLAVTPASGATLGALGSGVGDALELAVMPSTSMLVVARHPPVAYDAVSPLPSTNAAAPNSTIRACAGRGRLLT